jgi:hypothetical protein
MFYLIFICFVLSITLFAYSVVTHNKVSAGATELTICASMFFGGAWVAAVIRLLNL